MYQQVPNDTTCNIEEGGLAIFNCEITGICNTFSVFWFKYTNESTIRMNSSERISQSDGSSNKYQILTTFNPIITNDGHCNIGTTLIINQFNHSDNGYYWCQIVSNNNYCPLLPSPCGYVAVGGIMNYRSCNFQRRLPFPMCAEDAPSLTSKEMGCVSTAMIMPTTVAVLGPYSIHNYKINSTTATSTIIVHDNKDFDRDENNMIWLYGLMAAFLLIIVLVLILVVVTIKLRIQQKQSTNFRYVLCIYSILLYRIKLSP